MFYHYKTTHTIQFSFLDYSLRFPMNQTLNSSRSPFPPCQSINSVYSSIPTEPKLTEPQKILNTSPYHKSPFNNKKKKKEKEEQSTYHHKTRHTIQSSFLDHSSISNKPSLYILHSTRPIGEYILRPLRTFRSRPITISNVRFDTACTFRWWF